MHRIINVGFRNERSDGARASRSIQQGRAKHAARDLMPGISRYCRANVVEHRGWPQVYYNHEACIYDAAVFLFAMLALERPGVEG